MDQVQSLPIAFFDHEAVALASRYDAISFEEVHRALLPHLPPAPARVLDVGAGSGRDARALKRLGHRVLAIEPAAALREIGQGQDEELDWLDDRLPGLARVRTGGRRFDFILCSAVLMSLPPEALAPSFATMGLLLAPGGKLGVTVRDPMPREPVELVHRHSSKDLLAAAAGAGLVPHEQTVAADALGRAGRHWRSFLFGRSGDGLHSRDSAAATVRKIS